MLDLTGEGVLALWNGVEPSRVREYDAWHSREHVPQRVGVPGILGARRYVRTQGPLPEYLTLYALDDTGVLKSDAYRALLDNPTAWSRAMRPSFRGFMRLACRRLLTLGGGVGGALVALVVDESTDLRSPTLKRSLDALLKEQAIVAAHILERDPGIPDVPFQIGGDSPDFPRAGAILLEGYKEDELSLLLPAIRAVLAELDAATDTLTAYQLAYALDRGSLERVVPVGQR